MTFGVFECIQWWVGSMQTPLSPAAYCEPRRPTHSCKPAKSATFSSIVLELPLSDFRLLERSLSAWLSFLLISHELHSEQPNWQRISMKNGFPLPNCHSSACLMHQFCLFLSGLVLVWVILAFFNSDLTSNLVNQMSEQTQKKKIAKKQQWDLEPALTLQTTTSLLTSGQK